MAILGNIPKLKQLRQVPNLLQTAIRNAPDQENLAVPSMGTGSRKRGKQAPQQASKIFEVISICCLGEVVWEANLHHNASAPYVAKIGFRMHM